MTGVSAPPAPACIVTIRDMPVRLYAHPSVEHGRPWCALADVAGLVGYKQKDREAIADHWLETFPDLAVIAGDKAVLVSDSVIYAFLQWLENLGLKAAAAIRDAYELETGGAYLEMVVGLPNAVWRDAAQRSALADALPDPAGRAN